MGGVEYSTLRMSEALNKRGYDTLIICPEKGDLPNLARKQRLDVSIVPRPNFPSVSMLIAGQYFPNPLNVLRSSINIIRSAKIYEQYFKKNPVQIIISKGLLAHFYAGMAAKRRQIPCIWYIQEEVDKNRALGLYQHALSMGANNLPAKIVVDSSALISQFEGTLRGTKDIVIIPNGIDTNQFRKFTLQEQILARQKLGIPEHALVIGQAGRVIPLKGQLTTLRAFAQITQKDQDLFLLFVGTSLFSDNKYAEMLKIEAHKLNIAKRVCFSGFLPDVRHGLAAMDIFVHASIDTDSPLSVLEAMACELPVIVSAVKGSVDMIDHSIDGLLFKPKDVLNLAECLRLLANSFEKRLAFGKAARNKILAECTIEQYAIKFGDLIEDTYEKTHFTRP